MQLATKREECHSERIGVTLFENTTSFSEGFERYLKIMGSEIKTSHISVSGENEVVAIKASLIGNKTILKGFLKSNPINMGELAYRVGDESVLYLEYLSTKYPKYGYVQKNKDLIWLEYATFMGLFWAKLLYKNEHHCFADEWAEKKMEIVLMDHQIKREFHRANSTSDKEQRLIEQERAHAHYIELQSKIKHIHYEPIILPPGTPDPLALPERRHADA